MRPRQLAHPLPQRNQPVQAAHRHGKQRRHGRIVGQQLRQPFQRRVMAAQRDDRPGRWWRGRNGQIDGKSSGRSPIIFLHKTANHLRGDQFNQRRLFQFFQVMANFGRIAVQRFCQLAQRGRPAHEQAQNRQPPLIAQQSDLFKLGQGLQTGQVVHAAIISLYLMISKNLLS